MPASLFGVATREASWPSSIGPVRERRARVPGPTGFSPAVLFLNAEPAAIDVESLRDPLIEDG